MIYACNLVAGSQGQALINQIAAFTGADVAASNDITGQSGDWQLEVATGDIESESVLSSIVQDLYEGDLALLNNGDFEQGLGGWRTISGPGAITTDAVSGSSALELNGSSRGVRQTLSASGGSLYTLTGSGKTSSSGNTSIGITFYDQDFNRLAGRGQKIRTPNWQAFSIQEEAPTDTAYVRVWSYKSDNSGSFFLDNLDLSSTLVGPVTPPSSGVPSRGQKGSLTQAHLQAVGLCSCLPQAAALGKL